MLNLKFFSPLARTGTKDRLDRQLARKQARHDREAKRIMRQIAFLAGQLQEHRAARSAVAAARMELALDINTIEGEIAAGMLAEGGGSDAAPADAAQPVTMADVLMFAEAREAANG